MTFVGIVRKRLLALRARELVNQIIGSCLGGFTGFTRRRKQLAFTFRTWGGARAGAGRRPKGATAGVSHLRRSAHCRHHPAHVTLRIVRGVPSLRAHALFQRVQKALAQAKDRFGFRLVHFSVQRDHLHLIAEAADRRALSRGVQGLTIRVARAVNGQLRRKGRLFADRYHARALKTPRACHLALRYVLLNVRKHARSQDAVSAGFVDPCSSAPWFGGFVRPRELAFGAAQSRARFTRTAGMDAPVAPARVWLLRAELKRMNAFDVDDAPATPSWAPFRVANGCQAGEEPNPSPPATLSPGPRPHTRAQSTFPDLVVRTPVERH